ncbi:MAG: hypothetical protein GX225_05945 [Clostridiales bacterium]|nr:hypothetical protein [Clostridiales bacterium]
MKNIVYKLSIKMPGLKHIVQKIEGRLSILYPANRNSIICKTNMYLIKTYISAILVILGLCFFAEVSLYYSVLTGIIIFIIMDEKIDSGFEQLDTKVLKQLLKFVEDVKFRFQFNGMLEEALQESIGDAEHEMSVHGQKIYECLLESYFAEKQDYIEISPNHFFMTFYSLCETVLLYGDKKREDGSVFLKNLGYLKEEVNVELLKRSKIQSNFMGLKGICIIPMFAIKPIERWAVYNIPELENVYNGSFGAVSTILLCLMSIAIYKIVCILKAGSKIQGVSEMIKNITTRPRIENIIVKLINSNLKRAIKIDRLLKESAYGYNIKEFTVKRFITAISYFIISTILTIGFGLSDDFKQSIFLYMAVPILAVILGYYYGVISLKFRSQIILMDREEEIVRFQNIVLMMMHLDRISIEQIISEMERFAIVFKNILAKISDRYTYKGVRSFREAKEEADFPPFERLMDGFIACDDTYIYVAFEDMEKDRQYFLDRHKQENEHIISNKTTIAKMLSFIPLCAVILIKLIIPFVMEGMTSMQSGSLL